MQLISLVDGPLTGELRGGGALVDSRQAGKPRLCATHDVESAVHRGKVHGVGGALCVGSELCASEEEALVKRS